MEPSEIYKYNPINGKKFTKKAENLLVDEESGYRYYISPRPAVEALIVDDDNRVLIGRRAKEPQKDNLDLPGGFVDLGETFEEAIKREIREELGVDVLTLQYFCSSPARYVYKGVNEYVVTVCFKCTVSDPDKIKPADDIKDVKFLSKDELNLDDAAFNTTRNTLKLWMDSLPT